jgi:multimeric flavodoxin WrbA
MEEVVTMKKVTAFVGTARKKHTYGAVQEFLGRLNTLGDIDYEIVCLSDYRIEICKGCKTCFEKGEEFCPLKDDRDLLIEKMMTSDGVIFASPNYSFQVSGVMKLFLDRLGFVFHRPCFHSKAFTSIVVQGIYGGRKIVKYLDFVGGGLGFEVAKGTCTTALEPMTEKERQKRDKVLAKQSAKFYKQLSKPAGRVPRLLELWIFRMARTSIGIELNDRNRDYRYYSEKGWLKSDYYYPVHLGPFKRSVGNLCDSIAARMTKTRS